MGREIEINFIEENTLLGIGEDKVDLGDVNYVRGEKLFANEERISLTVGYQTEESLKENLKGLELLSKNLGVLGVGSVKRRVYEMDLNEGDYLIIK